MLRYQLDNLEERIVFYSIVCTFVLYFLGAQFIVFPIIGWVLFYRAWLRWSHNELNFHWLQLLWLCCSIFILMVQLVAVNNLKFDLFTTATTIIFDWMRGYGLISAFILSASLPIRPQVISRAVCILLIQCIIFGALFIVGTLIGLPQPLYVSPLQVIGRGGENYYVVNLSQSIEDGVYRTELYTPWAPALGFNACLQYFTIQLEKNKTFKYLSIFSIIFCIILSVSRLAIVAFPLAIFLVWILSNLKNIKVQIGVVLSFFLIGLASTTVIETLQNFTEIFNSSRKGSSVVRAKIQEISVYRWLNDTGTFWIGQGGIEPGPQIVSRIPLGTHHTWIGLLFTKGLLGFLSVLIPFIFTFIFILYKVIQKPTNLSKSGFGVVFILLMFSFGEAWDSLAYIVWPSLMILSMSFSNLRDKNKKEYINVFKDATN